MLDQLQNPTVILVVDQSHLCVNTGHADCIRGSVQRHRQCADCLLVGGLMLRTDRSSTIQRADRDRLQAVTVMRAASSGPRNGARGAVLHSASNGLAIFRVFSPDVIAFEY